VVAIPLPATLKSGETAVLMLDWDARLATLPRRQGRAGRHYDWAQWYPRIAVYENGAWQTQPLLPQGEFYGEFASYDITLDVAQDQVIGATGVPVEGDPGWRLAGGDEPTYRRDAYPARAAEPLGLLEGAPAADRKRVRWRAEAVHHFGWSNDPAYRYEQGAVGEIPIHVLYQASADTAWGGGIAVRRTERALGWLQQLFGPDPWPQLTNVHRLESGGTEFPMLIMDGSASEGLIVHEATHQYVHGALANNEWKEGWLDEGFDSFISNWYAEDHGGEDVWTRTLDALARRERAGQTEPIALASAEFSSPALYSAMTYTKPSVVFYMLRELVGEETMRRILRTYYERHKLSHVTEADLRAVVNQVTGKDYGWFFDQWIHTTDTLDYGVGEVSTQRQADGRWRTRVQVLRLGRAWMPVTLQVGDVRRTLESRERAQTVEIVTATRPAEVVLDPDRTLLDIDPTNNRKVVR
ncbi:MAG TPA: M1 family metallopeptidase, partial [Longimicrobiaceae bacterium]|nr:M1 family metallopeptidase [Longimicrobiaceae bacterium]